MAKLVTCSFDGCTHIRVQHDGTKLKNAFKVFDHVHVAHYYCSIECFFGAHESGVK